AGRARRNESAQFRPRLHQRNENHSRKIRRASARGSSSPSAGRKSQQHGNGRKRMRLRERQRDAQRLSEDPENRTWPVPSPLSPPETFNSENLITNPGRWNALSPTRWLWSGIAFGRRRSTLLLSGFKNFKLAVENRFQRKSWIEMIGSQPVAIEERRLIFVTRVAKDGDDGLTPARFFGDAHSAGNVDAARQTEE